jgi:hypothetical protein
MDANEHKYYYFNLCLFVFIRGFPYPLSSFLFSLFYFLFPEFDVIISLLEDFFNPVKSEVSKTLEQACLAGRSHNALYLQNMASMV